VGSAQGYLESEVEGELRGRAQADQAETTELLAMRMTEQLILNYEPRTLSRVYSETCNEAALHVRGVCNHCTAQPDSSGTAVRVSNRGRVAKIERPWRADHEATGKIRMIIGHNKD